MRIKEVCKITGLTDKAVRTYINNQLISPSFTENYTGRKNYSFDKKDIDTLCKIALLRKYDFSLSDIKQLLDNQQNVSVVLESHIKSTQQNVKETSFVLANLNNAHDKSITNLDDLCNVLSENIEPTNFDLMKQINSIWKKIKSKLPLLIIVCIIGFIISIVLLIIITILLSKLFLYLG